MKIKTFKIGGIYPNEEGRRADFRRKNGRIRKIFLKDERLRIQ